MMPLPHDRSHEVFQRSLRYLAGGVNSPVRAFRAVDGEPIVIARGEGPYLYDVDDNRYLIPDVSALSPHEQGEFTRYIYW